MFTSLHLEHRRLDRSDLPVEPDLLLLQPVKVGREGLRVIALPGPADQHPQDHSKAGTDKVTG